METIRQGDILLVKIDKLPDGLEPSDIKTFLENGSGGNPHSFEGGVFYPKNEDDFILGYFESKNTKIYHAEHSPNWDSIPDGVWQVRRQNEETIEGLKAVVD